MTKKRSEMTKEELAVARKNRSVHVSDVLHARMLRHFRNTGIYMSALVDTVINQYLDDYEEDTEVAPAIEKFNG